MTGMFDAALAALRQIMTPPFRGVLLKSLGTTLLILGAAWAGLDRLATSFLMVNHPWLQTALVYATGVGLFFALAFLIAPISVLITGIFLDDLADVSEAEIYPPGERGAAIPPAQAVWMGVKFAAISALVNLCALFLLLVPGVNAIVFVLANAYLFGREYFLFAATRFRPLHEAEALRSRFAPQLFIAGLFIAFFVMTPGLNILTPLFGVAYMTRIHQMLSPERYMPRGRSV